MCPLTFYTKWTENKLEIALCKLDILSKFGLWCDVNFSDAFVFESIIAPADLFKCAYGNL